MAFDRLTPKQLEYVVQFLHPEKGLAWSAGVNERILAPLYGLNVAGYRGLRAKFARRVRQAAKDLVKDAALARQVDRLPFQPGAVVVGLGDSITDDCQSWLEILCELLRIRRAADRIRVVNAGISGDTTSQMITRFFEVVTLKPDWIIAMPGTNDARRHGRSPTKCLVSIEETRKNLAMLRNFAATETSARWVWMTPARVIEQKIARWWLLAASEMQWRNRDLDAVAGAIRRQPGLVVDLQRVFGRPANPRLLMADGLHPSLEGQKAIVAALVDRLARSGPKPIR